MSVYDEKGPLDAKRVESAKPKAQDYKMRDRDNMYLAVTKKGKKYWRMDYRHDGKRKTLKIGTYPEVTLKQARIQCSDAKNTLQQGNDPSVLKKQPLTDFVPTFQMVGQDWYNTKIKNSTFTKRRKDAINSYLNNELYPHIGNKNIDDITPKDLLTIFKNIQTNGFIDKGKKVKGVTSQIFDYAIACDDCIYNPAERLKNALITKETRHHPTITDPKKVGKLMVDIDYFNGSLVVKTAFKLMPLVFLRPNELLNLEWCEVDFDKDQLSIPGKRMKMRQDHIVPLSRQAKYLLKDIQRVTGHSNFVFLSPMNNIKPVAHNCLNYALESIGYKNETLVPHGFRAMARTILDEVLEFNVDWIEQQLAHIVKDANGRAYNRTKHLNQRIEMMQCWADYLDELKQRASGSNIAYLSNTATIS